MFPFTGRQHLVFFWAQETKTALLRPSAPLFVLLLEDWRTGVPLFHSKKGPSVEFLVPHCKLPSSCRVSAFSLRPLRLHLSPSALLSLHGTSFSFYRCGRPPEEVPVSISFLYFDKGTALPQYRLWCFCHLFFPCEFQVICCDCFEGPKGEVAPCWPCTLFPPSKDIHWALVRPPPR